MKFDVLTASFIKRGCSVLLAMAMLIGCATQKPVDYTTFKNSRPASILVLPPINSSPDIAATYSMLSQVTFPLAESGYYVFPVSLMDETFRQNGLNNPAEIHEVNVKKLREIFGADSALYINIKEYGTTYAVLSSESRVTAEARLIDLRSEQLLWSGSATASSAEGRSSNNSLVGLLVQAVVNQIVESSTNRSHPIAGIASYRLLSAGRPNGILYGPRSPKYQKDNEAPTSPQD